MAAAFMLPACGCRDLRTAPEESATPKSEYAAEQRPLKLIVVDDKSIAAAATREWTARASRRLQVINVDAAEFVSWLEGDADELDDVDAMILASHWQGELAAHELIEPMPDYVRKNLTFADGDIGLATDILPLYRQSVMPWGESICGLPMGGHVFVLGYRKDIFDVLDLPIPDTIAAMRDAIQSYAAADKQAGWPPMAIAQPLAPDWAVHTFLARAAPYCRHRNRFSALFELQTMEPEIDGPEYRRALEELVEDARRSGDASVWPMTPTQSFQALCAGDCLMAIGWPGALDEATARGDVLEQIAIDEFPGANEVYSRSAGRWQQRLADEATYVPYAFPEDRVAIVLKSSRSQRAAWNLIARLSGKEWGSIVSDASPVTGPFRRSQLSGTGWAHGLPRSLADQYRGALESTTARRTYLSRLRMPANQQYLEALDSAVRDCLEDPQDVGRQLEEVALKWRKITEQQGSETQIDAFHRSLGLEP